MVKILQDLCSAEPQCKHVNLLLILESYYVHIMKNIQELRLANLKLQS